MTGVGEEIADRTGPPLLPGTPRPQHIPPPPGLPHENQPRPERDLPTPARHLPAIRPSRLPAKASSERISNWLFSTKLLNSKFFVTKFFVKLMGPVFLGRP